ncbi:hypothetical protein BCR35DRAFT_334432 [Leucosporidium creatinivorum]|uniref:Uncharacterized protein n=1 Tax=Leucosporidium creatinivorum TaxID=106004 RepID=A0A1Y2E923_9BASI|nr:hypothetical protein BCR35DRAFT_334432 [Leucosporidium creatinivorum]
MANQLLTKRNITLSLGGLASLAAGAYKFLDSYLAPRLRDAKQQQDSDRLALKQEVDRNQLQSEREMSNRLLQTKQEMSDRLLDTKQDVDRRFLLLETSVGRIEKELLRMKLSGKLGENELDAEMEKGGESEKEG